MHENRSLFDINCCFFIFVFVMYGKFSKNVAALNFHFYLQKDSESDYDDVDHSNSVLNTSLIKTDLPLKTDSYSSMNNAASLMTADLSDIKQEDVSLDCFENNSDTSTQMVIDEQSVQDDSSGFNVDIREESSSQDIKFDVKKDSIDECPDQRKLFDCVDN